ELLQRFRGQGRILARDEQLDRLARVLVRHAARGPLEPARMRAHDVLDLVRVRVGSGYEDPVLLAVDDVAVAALVHARNVAGTQPAVADRLRGFLRPLPVAAHDLRSAHAQLTDLAARQVSAVVVLYRHVGRWNRQADRPVVLGEIERIDAYRGRGFGEPVGLGERAAGDLLPALGDRALYRHAAAEGQVQRGEVEPLEARRVEQPVEQRIDPGERAEAPLAEFRDETLHVARVGDQDAVATDLHEGQAVRGQREDVIQRQRGDDDFLALAHQPADPCGGLLHVRDHVAMGQLGALGDAGGSAGVLQEREI